MIWGIVLGKGIKLKLVAKPWARKEDSSYKFFQLPIRKRLS